MDVLVNISRPMLLLWEKFVNSSPDLFMMNVSALGRCHWWLGYYPISKGCPLWCFFPACQEYRVTHEAPHVSLDNNTATSKGDRNQSPQFRHLCPVSSHLEAPKSNPWESLELPFQHKAHSGRRAWGEGEGGTRGCCSPSLEMVLGFYRELTQWRTTHLSPEWGWELTGQPSVKGMGLTKLTKYFHVWSREQSDEVAENGIITSLHFTEEKTKAQSREMDVSGHLMASRRVDSVIDVRGLLRIFPLPSEGKAESSFAFFMSL